MEWLDPGCEKTWACRICPLSAQRLPRYMQLSKSGGYLIHAGFTRMAVSPQPLGRQRTPFAAICLQALFRRPSLPEMVQCWAGGAPRGPSACRVSTGSTSFPPQGSLADVSSRFGVGIKMDMQNLPTVGRVVAELQPFL